MPTYRGARVYRPSGNTYTPTQPFSSDKWGQADYEDPLATTQELLSNDAIKQNYRMEESVKNPNFDARTYGLLGWPTASFIKPSGWSIKE